MHCCDRSCCRKAPCGDTGSSASRSPGPHSRPSKAAKPAPLSACLNASVLGSGTHFPVATNVPSVGWFRRFRPSHQCPKAVPFVTCWRTSYSGPLKRFASLVYAAASQMDQDDRDTQTASIILGGRIWLTVSFFVDTVILEMVPKFCKVRPRPRGGLVAVYNAPRAAIAPIPDIAPHRLASHTMQTHLQTASGPAFVRSAHL